MELLDASKKIKNLEKQKEDKERFTMYLCDDVVVSGLGSDHSHSRTTVGIVVGSVLGPLLVASVGVCIWIKRRRRTGKASPARNM